MKSLLIGLFAFLTGSIFSQTFEYAMSEPGNPGSRFHDIEIMGDKIILAGGFTSCAQPAIWVFDKQGNYEGFKKFDTAQKSGYFYGYRTQIRHDSARENLSILIWAQRADDVAGASIFHLTLNEDLEVIEERDLLGQMHFDARAEFSNEYISIVGPSEHMIFDEKLELVSQKNISPISYENISTYVNDSIVARHYFGAENDNRIVVEERSTGISNTYEIPQSDISAIINDFLFVMDKENQIRKYSLDPYAETDSLALTKTEKFHFIKSGDDNLQLAVYDSAENTKVLSLTHNLQIAGEYNTGLKDMVKTGIMQGDNYIYAGTDYEHILLDYPVPPDTRRGLIPFLRKINLNEFPKNTDEISIQEIEIISVPEPGQTTTTMSGRILNFYHMVHEPMIFDIIFKNTGDVTIEDFTYFTDQLYGFNCAQDFHHRYVERISLSPGEEYQIRDSLFLYSIYEDRGLIFYTGAPNHTLTEEDHFQLLDFSTAVNDVRFDKIDKVYPNPTKDFLYFESPTIAPSGTLEILNVDGSLIRQISFSKNQIFIGNLPAGVYYLRLIDDQNIYVGNFVKI